MKNAVASRRMGFDRGVAQLGAQLSVLAGCLVFPTLSFAQTTTTPQADTPTAQPVDTATTTTTTAPEANPPNDIPPSATAAPSTPVPNAPSPEPSATSSETTTAATGETHSRVANATSEQGTVSPTEPVPSEPVPSRSDRVVAVTGSLGWNSLAGFAFGGTFNFGPYVAADVAFGIAAIGFKTGGRVRYNVLKSNWTPTFGVGVQYGPGSGGRAINVDGQDGAAELVVEPSAYVQGLAGVSYQARGGFTALFGAGYSVLLDDDNVRLVSGSEETADITRLVTQSGLVLEVALGYAF